MFEYIYIYMCVYHCVVMSYDHCAFCEVYVLCQQLTLHGCYVEIHTMF